MSFDSGGSSNDLCATGGGCNNGAACSLANHEKKRIRETINEKE
jgi:hypothetical protein